MCMSVCVLNVVLGQSTNTFPGTEVWGDGERKAEQEQTKQDLNNCQSVKQHCSNTAELSRVRQLLFSRPIPEINELSNVADRSSSFHLYHNNNNTAKRIIARRETLRLVLRTGHRESPFSEECNNCDH